MNLNKVFADGLVKSAVNECNGKLVPLLFQFDYSKVVALMNPSIYNDNGTLRCCVRGINYIMHNSEKFIFPHWGSPLQYIHPEHDVRLATENYIVDLTDDLDITNPRYVDMKLNVKPKWSFHGLEDARLMRWNGKLYLCGVRRDTTDNGQGRMELSEIELTDPTAVEVSRNRIPTVTDAEYCEKNWMPIIDKPYHFMRFANPVEIDYYENGKTVALEQYKSELPVFHNMRGSSQVIPYKDYYLAIGHTVKLWKPYSGEKTAEYYHHMILWDKDFNLIKITDEFKFLNSKVEFCCGMCLDNNNKLLISISECDNIPFVLRLDPDWLIERTLNYDN